MSSNTANGDDVFFAGAAPAAIDAARLSNREIPGTADEVVSSFVIKKTVDPASIHIAHNLHIHLAICSRLGSYRRDATPSEEEEGQQNTANARSTARKRRAGGKQK